MGRRSAVVSGNGAGQAEVRMSGKILIVDDDKGILKLYVKIFTGKGYAVDASESFAEAARLIEANDYDLLVTDLMFTDGVGTELIKLFEKKRAGAKSLLVTGAPDAAARLQSSGITEYFLKPFKVQLFMDAVAKAMNG